MSTETASPVVAAPGGSFLLETRNPSEIFTPEDLSEEQRQIAAFERLAIHLHDDVIGFEPGFVSG